MRRALGPVVLSAIVVMSAFAPAAAQDEVHHDEPVILADSPSDELLQPYLESNIPTQADAVAAELRRLEVILQPSAQVESINRALSDRELTMSQLEAAIPSLTDELMSQRRLADQIAAWSRIEGELAAWAEVVQSRYGELHRERNRIREERARWEATALRAVEDEVAPELIRQIDDLLTQLRDVEQHLRIQRNRVAAISNRITTSREVVRNANELLDALATQFRSGLFTRNAFTVWRAVAETSASDLTGEIRSAGQYWISTVSDRADRGYGKLVPMPPVLLVMLLLAYALRRQSRKLAGDDIPQGTRALAERPISLALAITLIIMVALWPHDLPMGTVGDLLALLAIVPLVRIGAVVLRQNEKRLTYVIAGLWILERASSLSTFGSAVNRLLLLLVSSIAFAYALLVFRRRLQPGWQQDLWRRVEVGLAGAAMVLLGVAVLGNLLGWLALARLLTEGTIVSLVAAIAWAIVVGSFRAVIPLFLRGWLSRKLLSVQNQPEAIRRTLTIAVMVVAVIHWTLSTLSRFAVGSSSDDLIRTVLDATASIGGLSISVGGVLGATIMVGATMLAARFTRFVLSEEVLPRLTLRPSAGTSIVTLANYAVWGIGITTAATAAGLTGTQIAVVLGALSVGIGFGLTTIINNFVSGLILIFERPISVGDTVETADSMGKVQRIGIRASVIKNFDGAEIIVPNADLISRQVTNWTRSDSIRRLEVLVGVTYGTDATSVLELLLSLAKEHPNVLTEPEPRAHMVDFGDSSLDFRLRCWAGVNEWVTVASDLRVAVQKALANAEIEVPFPQRDLHLKSSKVSLASAAVDAD